MKIVIISDNHGSMEGMRRVFEKEAPMDYIFHLGDSQMTEQELVDLAPCPLLGVSGNCDFFTDLPGARIEELCGHRILMTHGHHQFLRQFGTRFLEQDAVKNYCDIAIFGHTHKPLKEDKGAVLMLNPGSIARPRQSDGRCTDMVMKLEENKRAEVELKSL